MPSGGGAVGSRGARRVQAGAALPGGDPQRRPVRAAPAVSPSSHTRRGSPPSSGRSRAGAVQAQGSALGDGSSRGPTCRGRTAGACRSRAISRSARRARRRRAPRRLPVRPPRGRSRGRRASTRASPCRQHPPRSARGAPPGARSGSVASPASRMRRVMGSSIFAPVQCRRSSFCVLHVSTSAQHGVAFDVIGTYTSAAAANMRALDCWARNYGVKMFTETRAKFRSRSLRIASTPSQKDGQREGGVPVNCSHWAIENRCLSLQHEDIEGEKKVHVVISYVQDAWM